MKERKKVKEENECRMKYSEHKKTPVPSLCLAQSCKSLTSHDSPSRSPHNKLPTQLITFVYIVRNPFMTLAVSTGYNIIHISSKKNKYLIKYNCNNASTKIIIITSFKTIVLKQLYSLFSYAFTITMRSDAKLRTSVEKHHLSEKSLNCYQCHCGRFL